MILPINETFPEPRKVKRAVEALEAGEVIAYPTDTVYGLGCDLFNKKAIDRLYEIKRMDRAQQLAFICPDLGDIARYAIVENAAYRILRRLLPGPYCFILEATREVPRLVQSKRKTVGIRIPHHEVILAIVRELGRPVMSTTANVKGEDPFVDPRDIDDAFPGLGLVLDAGGSGLVPTTVVDLTGGTPVVVREGAGPVDALLRPTLVRQRRLERGLLRLGEADGPTLDHEHVALAPTRAHAQLHALAHRHRERHRLPRGGRDGRADQHALVREGRKRRRALGRPHQIPRARGHCLRSLAIADRASRSSSRVLIASRLSTALRPFDSAISTLARPSFQ